MDLNDGGAVHQILGRVTPGDAATENGLAIQRRLRHSERRSELFAEQIHPRLARAVRPLREFAISERSVCLFHVCEGWPARVAHASAARLGIVAYQEDAAALSVPFGRSEVVRTFERERTLRAFVTRAELALAGTEAARGALAALGFRATALLPMVPEPMERVGMPVLQRLFRDKRVNILFAGRLMPDERIDELLRAFAVYQRFVRPASRLILVGDRARVPRYYGALTRLVDELRLEQVVFPGPLDGEELRACYAEASVFVSFALDGEGARLREAMAAGVPILVGKGVADDLMLGSGVRVQGERLDDLAELIDTLATPGPLRQGVVVKQAQALGKAGLATRQLLDSLTPLLIRTTA
jgi:glycosyltransferase involved in cell wall biosynthesis